MGFFDLNYHSLIGQLMPVGLRKAKMSAWLNCCAAPLERLLIQFRASRSRDLYQAMHSSQVAHMEGVLNDTFDPGARQIRIVDGQYKDPVFVYQPDEVRTVWVGLDAEVGIVPFAAPATLYTDGETTLLGNLFVVEVPTTLPFSETRMRAMLNQYRIAGRNVYEIITV